MKYIMLELNQPIQLTRFIKTIENKLQLISKKF